MYSSPTVVNGTAFVGTGGEGTLGDGSAKVLAIETDVEGSSEGSRVRQGALGHHHTWAESVEPFPAPGEQSEQDDGGTDDLLLPGAAAGVAGLGGIGYVLKRRLSREGEGE